MTILTLALCLFAGALFTLAIGAIIVKRDKIRNKEKEKFWDSVSFMRSLIETSALDKQGYSDCLVVFREFKLMPYCNKKVYKSLVSDFLFKYRDFLSCDKADPKIKIIPDNTEGYYNYKIQV